MKTLQGGSPWLEVAPQAESNDRCGCGCENAECRAERLGLQWEAGPPGEGAKARDDCLAPLAEFATPASRHCFHTWSDQRTRVVAFPRSPRSRACNVVRRDSRASQPVANGRRVLAAYPSALPGYVPKPERDFRKQIRQPQFACVSGRRSGLRNVFLYPFGRCQTLSANR